MNTTRLFEATRPIGVRLSTRLAALGLLALLGACQQMPNRPVVDFAEPRINTGANAAVQRAPSGGLFQNASYRPGFEDRRARAVGDTVTIQIVENVTASQKSTSTMNRTSSIDGGITALPFNTKDGLGQFGVGASTANTFAGKGGTESANTFSGSITSSVIEVLPNGHLVVAGEKQIGVNQNVDVLRFSGTIDPRMLQPNSIINSTQVANVRVESRGRGAQDEAQTVGWLSRFFLSLNPF